MLATLFRNAVFVDAGYLFSQGSVGLTGAKTQRSQLRLNEAEIINQLKAIASSDGTPLLRIYWYDGARGGGMTQDQSLLAEMADVKVRLGYINSAGDQKGVDSLLITDLIELARNRAIADAYIITSDGDMRVAVQIAQSFGVRVHLVTLEPSGVSLNPQLRQEVDTFQEIPRKEISKFLSVVVPTPQILTDLAASSAMPSKVNLESATKQAIRQVLEPLDGVERNKLKITVSSTSSVPQPFDGRILATCGALLKRPLNKDENKEMRRLVTDWIQQS